MPVPAHIIARETRIACVIKAFRSQKNKMKASDIKRVVAEILDAYNELSDYTDQSEYTLPPYIAKSIRYISTIALAGKSVLEQFDITRLADIPIEVDIRCSSYKGENMWWNEKENEIIIIEDTEEAIYDESSIKPTQNTTNSKQRRINKESNRTNKQIDRAVKKLNPKKLEDGDIKNNKMQSRTNHIQNNADRNQTKDRNFSEDIALEMEKLHQDLLQTLKYLQHLKELLSSK
ncbi:hypothetical protein FA95DRAFT_1577267 [Auriscalpium vulgare]|uniref:Uncharacterized protein n=1 Tax=Auriscalpium vulgare TaxID=40419 RepID=A0ACB8R8I6_9AGAM|nr:hypothetical protein FA95DRAFT_1577267 [Auriscalpium vulgare]